MNSSVQEPNEQIAVSVVAGMTGEHVISSTRLTTDEQYYVYAVKTTASEYVIRMTNNSRKDKFLSAIYWQEKLIPLGVPLAKFIQTDLDGEHSPFPALLMLRLDGDDICNIYSELTDLDKRNIAAEMVRIQSLTTSLPDGSAYGIISRFGQQTGDISWSEFILNRLILFKEHIKQNGLFSTDLVDNVISIATKMDGDLSKITPSPFLWDASERNVLVDKGKITGIVDVDDMCFGDPLFVIALTSVSLAVEGLDTKYTDYWAELLHLSDQAKRRLAFYKLFYVITFMRKHGMKTTNSKTVSFDTRTLLDLYTQSFDHLNQHD